MITVLYECFCSLTSVYVYSVCFIIAVNTLVLFVSTKCSSVVWELELEVTLLLLYCVSKLTAKNIQCMRAILSMAQYYGGMLGTAWHYILATTQVLIQYNYYHSV